jgi:N-methylhydantoinase B
LSTSGWRLDGYSPPDALNIDPKLELHTDVSPYVDPATYEVVRYSLWNINIEHGRTMMNTAASPVAAYSHDFNPTILTEEAEFVFYGPYIQFLSSALDLTIKWILENRSSNPGIVDGDIWLSNDCWVGATHQMDAVAACPVFWEGKLFCWIANTMHQYDLGGATPGGFATSATSVHEESLMFPPIKLVERNELRRDVEELFTRSSRNPSIVSLDLRAEVAGCNVARKRIHELLERYGASTVKAVMRGVIERSEQAFREKMLRLPDGVWRERGYTEQAFPGDRSSYPICISVTKVGAELTISNAGTALSAGSMNMTIAGWRGAVVNAVAQACSYDQLFAVGGPLRHIKFDSEPGTILSARHPAAVSCGVNTMQFVMVLMANCMNRLMSTDVELKRDICTAGSCSFTPLDAISGTDREGNGFGVLTIDMVGGGIGAFSHRDGIPTGGVIWDPMGRMPEVEEGEATFPLLYLYRKQLTDSGGAGKFSRGNSLSFAWVPHGTDSITHDLASPGTAIPSSLGVFGGRPGSANSMRFWRGSHHRRLFGEGRLPMSPDDAQAASVEILPPRAASVVQDRDTVYEQRVCGGGGYGDPLERPPGVVVQDVSLGLVSPELARQAYCVALTGEDPNGYCADTTRMLRDEAIKARVTVAPGVGPLDPGAVILTLGDHLAVVEGTGGGMLFACLSCGIPLGSVDGNYKAACSVQSMPLEEWGPYLSTDYFLDEHMVFRNFCCPGCGALMDSELAIPSDLPLHDIQLSVEWLANRSGGSRLLVDTDRDQVATASEVEK